MKCEVAQTNIVLMAYGELADENSAGLDEHLVTCENCRRELNSVLALQEAMQLVPVQEPTPNLVAQSRMKLDEALDNLPQHGWLTRMRGLFFSSIGTVVGAPALATLLVGIGFLAGNYTYRYQVAHQPKLPTPVVMTSATNGSIANVTSIVQTPNQDLVQVNYNQVIPTTVQGSLDDPQIRQLLMMGTKAGVTNGVRADSVSLLAAECKAGHECDGNDQGTGIRNALLASLRTEKNPTVRMKALDGLQPYVAQDREVRNAVLMALLHDSNAGVRTAAINLLEPVQADSSVRQVLHTVSTQDANPYIRNASLQVLQGASSIQ